MVSFHRPVFSLAESGPSYTTAYNSEVSYVSLFDEYLNTYDPHGHGLEARIAAQK